MVYLGHGHLLRISRDPHWPLHSLKMDAWKTIPFPFGGVRAWFFLSRGELLLKKKRLVLGARITCLLGNSYKPWLVTWKGLQWLQCIWYYVTWPYKLQSPSSWVIAPGELGKGSWLAGPWRIESDSWNVRIWSRNKNSIHFFGGKKYLSKKSIHFFPEKNILAKKSIHFFLEGGEDLFV